MNQTPASTDGVSGTQLDETFSQFIRQRRAESWVSPGIEPADETLQQPGSTGKRAGLRRNPVRAGSGIDLSRQHPLLHRAGTQDLQRRPAGFLTDPSLVTKDETGKTVLDSK